MPSFHQTFEIRRSVAFSSGIFGENRIGLSAGCPAFALPMCVASTRCSRPSTLPFLGGFCYCRSGTTYYTMFRCCLLMLFCVSLQLAKWPFACLCDSGAVSGALVLVFTVVVDASVVGALASASVPLFSQPLFCATASELCRSR